MKILLVLVLSMTFSNLANAANRAFRSPAAWSSNSKLCGYVTDLGQDDSSSNALIRVQINGGSDTLSINPNSVPIFSTVIANSLENKSLYCFFYLSNGDALKTLVYVEKTKHME